MTDASIYKHMKKRALKNSIRQRVLASCQIYVLHAKVGFTFGYSTKVNFINNEGEFPNKSEGKRISRNKESDNFKYVIIDVVGEKRGTPRRKLSTPKYLFTFVPVCSENNPYFIFKE